MSLTKHSNLNVATIGVGQGGSNLAISIANKFNSKSIGLINLSTTDLNALINAGGDIQNLHIGGRVDGAGKDREESLAVYSDENNRKAVKEFIWRTLDRKFDNDYPADILFICYSTAGGTGSGIGPLLTAYVNSVDFRTRDGVPSRMPIVFGVAICPDSSEGIKNQQNTLEALSQISTFSEKRLARYILVNNDIDVTASEETTKHISINERVSANLYRYLAEIHTSRMGNLDRQDRIVALNYPGVHSFCSFDGPDNIQSPFILPEGARVRGLYGEVVERTNTSTIDEIITTLGLQVDDKTIGYYEDTGEGTTPILHFSGYSNLKRVTERYQNIVSQIKSKSERAEKIDQTLGTGLTKIKSNKDWIDSTTKVSTDANFSSLFDMINEE